MFVGKPKLLSLCMQKAAEILGTFSYILVNADPRSKISDFPISTSILPDPKDGKIKPHFFPYNIQK